MKIFRGREPDPQPEPGLDPELQMLMALEEAERRAEGAGVPVDEDPELLELLRLEEEERRQQG